MCIRDREKGKLELKEQQLRDEFDTDNVEIAQPTEIDNAKVNDTKDLATLEQDTEKPEDVKPTETVAVTEDQETTNPDSKKPEDSTVTATKDQGTPNPDSKKPGDSKTEDPDFHQAES